MSRAHALLNAGKAASLDGHNPVNRKRGDTMTPRTRLLITTQTKAYIESSTKYTTLDKLLRSAYWRRRVEDEIARIAFEMWYKGEINEEITITDLHEIFEAAIA